MHVARSVSTQHTAHNHSINFEFWDRNEEFLRCHATLINKSHLDNWKWHWLIHVSLPSQHCKPTKSVEIASTTNNTNKEHICTSLVIILSELHVTVIKDTLAEWWVMQCCIDFDSNKISQCADQIRCLVWIEIACSCPRTITEYNIY